MATVTIGRHSFAPGTLFELSHCIALSNRYSSDTDWLIVAIDFVLLLLNRIIYSFCLAFCFRHCGSAVFRMFLVICCLLNKISE